MKDVKIEIYSKFYDFLKEIHCLKTEMPKFKIEKNFYKVENGKKFFSGNKNKNL
jgi:hypothetical protein